MLEALHVKHKRNPVNVYQVLHKAVVCWRMRGRTRRALRDLEDWQLDDIGIDRETANLEGSTPFWQ